jgi:nucleotide sugar dehydrogenase
VTTGAGGTRAPGPDAGPAWNPACAVVGLGPVGTSTVRLLVRAGLPVRGYDIAAEALGRARAELAAELGPGPGWEVGADPAAALAGAEVVVVAVRLGRDVGDGGGRVSRDDALRAVAGTLGRHGRDGQLVVVESTAAPGTTRRFAAEWLRRPGIEVAHAPERLRVGDDDAALKATPRLVGGLTPPATARACALLRRVGISPVPVSAPEVSELAKLLENAFLATGIGLVGEVTRVAHALGLSAREVTEAAATKPRGYFPFHPGPGVGGHCLRNDLDLLRRHAADLGLEAPLLDGVAAAAAGMPGTTVSRLLARLAEQGREPAGARILLVGVGFKPGSADLAETPAAPVARLLRAAGAEPAYADSQVPAFAVDGVPLPRRIRGAPGRVVPADAALAARGRRALTAEPSRGLPRRPRRGRRRRGHARRFADDERPLGPWRQRRSLPSTYRGAPVAAAGTARGGAPPTPTPCAGPRAAGRLAQQLGRVDVDPERGPCSQCSNGKSRSQIAVTRCDEAAGPPVRGQGPERLASEHADAAADEEALLRLLPVAHHPLPRDDELAQLQPVGLVVAGEESVRPAAVPGRELGEVEVGDEVAEGEEHPRPLHLHQPERAGVAERRRLGRKSIRVGRARSVNPSRWRRTTSPR